MAGGLLTREPPVLSGLLGPGINPLLAAQGRNAAASQARGIRPSPFFDPEFYSRDLGPSAANYFSDPENALRALAVAPVPILSDAAGLAADAMMYKNKPESRNMLNFGLTGLGMLPFVPALATAYHGSPYKFDKFDAAHIGKGEGAQAYGHGIYFAESPGVAQEYRERLSKNVTVDGSKLQTIPSDGPLAEAHNMIVRNIQNGMKPDEAIFATQKYWADAANEMRSFVKSNPELADRIHKESVSRMQVSDAAATLKSQSFYKDPGSLYKVDIPDEYIPRMLDWDKPLSQQSDAVQKAILANLPTNYPSGKSFKGPTQRSLEAVKSGDLSRMNGQDLYYLFGGYNSPDQASAMLKSIGIPGIRYLDGGSRGTGQGTSNFVIFPGNEGAVKILERK